MGDFIGGEVSSSELGGVSGVKLIGVWGRVWLPDSTVEDATASPSGDSGGDGVQATNTKINPTTIVLFIGNSLSA